MQLSIQTSHLGLLLDIEVPIVTVNCINKVAGMRTCVLLVVVVVLGLQLPAQAVVHS